MSFYTAVESQPRLNQQVHLPKCVRTMTAEKGTIEHKSVLPPMNYFGGVQRLKPQSSFSTTNLFSTGSQIDYWLSYNGFLEQVRLELQLQVNPAAAAPLSVIGPYLIDHIEIYDSNQNIMQTIYNDTFFLERIHWDNNKSKFENNASYVNTTNYGPITGIAASTKFNLELFIPSCIGDAQLKGNIIDGKILIRVYFSALGVTSGAATDLWCNQCDIIQHAEQLSGALESLEVGKKKNKKLNYRVLNPCRVASYVIANAVASQQYDVILTSATQMSAFLYFCVRPSPLSASNIQSYVTGISFELYDAGMTLVGITQVPENNRFVVAQKFGGDIFNSSIGNGIYVLPFSTNIEKAYAGSQNGFYQFTTRETLRLYMPAGLVSGNYIVEVYSMDYAELIADNGRLDFKK